MIENNSNVPHVSNIMVNRLTDSQITELCSPHKCNDNAAVKIKEVNEATENFLKVIRRHCANCADSQNAARCAREARLWANSAIALDPDNQEA